MPAIGFGLHGGENSKVSGFLLAMEQSALAENMDFFTGKATPLAGPLRNKTAAAGAVSLASVAGRLAELPYAAHSAEVGGDLPRALIAPAQYKPVVAVYSSGSFLAAPLSVPPPRAAPVVSVSGNAEAGATTQTQIFAFAFSRGLDGAESQLSPVAEVQIKAGQTASVSIPHNLFPASFSGYGAQPPVSMGGGDKIRLLIYRSTGGSYLRLAAFDYDNLSQPSRGFSATAAGGIAAQFVGEETAARDNLRGVGIHPKGFAFGFAGDRLCFSAVQQFGVWPRSYELRVPEGNIEAVAEYAGNLYVFPQGAPPRVVRLDTPLAADSPVPAESNWQLSQAGSIVNMGEYGLWYACEAGLVSLPSGRLLTRNILAERGAGAFEPPAVAWKAGDEYFGARQGDVFVVSMRGAAAATPQVGRISVAGVVSAARVGGATYILAAGEVLQWAAGKKLRLRYKTGKIPITDFTNLALGWVAGGAASESSQFIRDPLRWWGGPPPFGALDFGLIARELKGDVILRVHTRQGAEEKNIANFGVGAGNVFSQAEVDCLFNLANRDVTSWVELELISDREIDYMGVFPNRRYYKGMRDRMPLLPPTSMRAA